MLKIRKSLISLLTGMLLFSGLSFSETEEQYVKRVSELCTQIGDVAEAAVDYRESKRPQKELLSKIDKIYKGYDFMKEYSYKVIRGIYENPNEFTKANAKQQVVGVCVTSLMQERAKNKNINTQTYACTNIATMTRNLVRFREDGIPKEKLIRKFKKSSEKGDELLKSLDYEKEALNEAMDAINYIYSNPDMDEDTIFKSYLAKCLENE